MLISAFIRTIYIPARIEIAEQYEKKLYSVAAMFSAFIGHPAKLSDFSDQKICDFLTSYRKSWTARATNNQRPQWYALPESCREVIERTQPGNRKLIWAHPWHPRTVWVKARRIIEEAGLPAPKTGRQLFHRLRRTTITLCAAVDPAIAQQTAGHKDYATTLKHYVDPRKLHSRSTVDILPDPLETDKPRIDGSSLLYHSEAPRFHIYG